MSETVIDDNTIIDNQGNGGLCGCLPRRSVYGSLPFAQPASVKLIPWEEMPDRIADQDKHQSSLEHLWRDSPMGALNQGQLNYCWCFSGAGALMLERAIQGLPFVRLSASSIGAPLVSYQNVGYFPEECLKAMVDQGASSTEYVPEATFNAADFKPGWRESAGMNKVTMFADVNPRDLQAQFTMLLLNRPLAVGLNWWGHSVLFLRVLDRNPSLPASNPNRYGTKFLNSWGPDWGEGGTGILEGSKQYADQSYAIEQATFAE